MPLRKQLRASLCKPGYSHHMPIEGNAISYLLPYVSAQIESGRLLQVRCVSFCGICSGL